jgi:hypothetical protein
MTLTHTHYELGARELCPTKKGPILVRNTKTIEGVLAWAAGLELRQLRDGRERTALRLQGLSLDQ